MVLKLDTGWNDVHGSVDWKCHVIDNAHIYSGPSVVRLVVIN